MPARAWWTKFIPPGGGDRKDRVGQESGVLNIGTQIEGVHQASPWSSSASTRFEVRARARGRGRARPGEHEDEHQDATEHAEGSVGGYAEIASGFRTPRCVPLCA